MRNHHDWNCWNCVKRLAYVVVIIHIILHVGCAFGVAALALL